MAPLVLLCFVLLTMIMGSAADPRVARAAPGHTTSTQTLPVRPGPVRPGISVDFVSVSWRGPRADGEIRFRGSGAWTRWRELPVGDVGRRGRVTSELVRAGTAREIQVRLPRRARAGLVLAIDASRVPSRRFEGRAARVSSPVGMLCYRDRAAWGAEEALRPPSAPAFFPVQVLTAHHTATANDDPDPAATVRAIFAQHVVGNGWDDIGYHLLIDQRGCVYEGRASGGDGLPVYAGFPVSGQPFVAVNGAHAAGFNAGNVGVALLGEFTDERPTRAARRALVGVLGLLAASSRIDADGRVHYVNPISGATRDVDAITGHRDWNVTECPGEQLYAELPGIRSRIAALLAPWRPPPELTQRW